MDGRNEIKEFLASRRARITPRQAGLPVYGGNRRGPGLRREEVALLAGTSVDYYVRLPGLSLTALTAEPGSPNEDALRLPAGWAATADEALPPQGVLDQPAP